MNQTSTDSAIQAQDGKLLRWLPWIAGVLALGLIIGYAIIFRSLPINERPDAWGQFAEYGFLKHLPRNNLRTIAEKQLHPRSFGQKWATDHLLAPAQAMPC